MLYARTEQTGEAVDDEHWALQMRLLRLREQHARCHYDAMSNMTQGNDRTSIFKADDTTLDR